jgi:integrase
MSSIRKRTWRTAKGEVRTAWCIDIIDAAGQRCRKQFATRREAEALRVQIESQQKAGTWRPDAGKVTVKEACDLYLEHCRGRMERRERMTRHNLKVYEGHVRNHILHAGHGISAIKLAQLTARTVGDLRDALRDAGVSVPTTRKVLATLHGVLAYAIGRDLIAVNPVHGVKVIGRRDEGARKIMPPSKDDLRTLIEVADPDFRIKLVVASATGLRAGELHALRWRRVDLEKGEVTVETRVDAYGDEDVTKTAAGIRSVPLGATVAQMLKAWRLKARYARDEDLVFANRLGGYVGHDNMVKRRFKPLFEKTGVAPFNWHALRHFAISTWIESGLSPKTVQSFAGHSSLQVTMDRYGHLFPSEDHQQAMERIAKGMFEPSR